MLMQTSFNVNTNYIIAGKENTLSIMISIVGYNVHIYNKLIIGYITINIRVLFDYT